MALTISGLTITGGLVVTSYTTGFLFNYLLVAGGGGGGGATNLAGQGGGGAGGFKTSNEYAVAGTTAVITIGAGATGTITRGTSGSNSLFDTIIAYGGGGGGGGTDTGGTRDGAPGGSGGGGSYIGGGGAAIPAGQGNVGGGGPGAISPYPGGGGGGAGAAGSNGSGSIAGAGGIGLDWPTGTGTIGGTTVWDTTELIGTGDLVAKTNGGWGSFMNAYAIWHTSGSSTVGVDQTVTVAFPYTGLYAIQAAADNGVTVYVDGVSRTSTTTYTGSVTVNITLANGNHDIRVVAYNSGGPGGVSVLVSSLTTNYYAGGGGGGVRTGGSGGGGGAGGGGNGALLSNTNGGNATANTGGGGGGSSQYTSLLYGGNGGSGIAIVRYSDVYPESAATGATYVLADGYRTYTWATSGSIKFFSPFTAVDLTYDPTWSGGGFMVSGNTVTTTGQFASVLYAIVQTTGKIYFEFTVISDFSDGYGWYVGVQRVPTLVGNYHNGTSGNGNGGAGTAFGSIVATHTYGVLIDLDAQTVSWNGAAAVAIPGSGQLYFAVYDGTSSGTGSGSINWGTSSFVNTVPAGAIPAGSV